MTMGLFRLLKIEDPFFVATKLVKIRFSTSLFFK